MEIYVESRSKVRRENLANLARLFVHQLKLDNSRYHLSIITESGVIDGIGANATVVDLGEKKLVMVLDRSLRFPQLIQTIAHEMIHVKQFCRGQLTQHINRKGEIYFKWMGRRYDTNYYDRPWELDAFRNERVLANQVYRLVD